MTDYKSIELTHRDGIREIRFHSDGGPLLWNEAAHREAPLAFHEVGSDPDIKDVIITGTGDNLCAEIDRPNFIRRSWEKIWWEGKRLLQAPGSIDALVMGAVNRPALIHAEMPLPSDMVLAAEPAVFQDRVHFRTDAVPGDGAQVVWPYLPGPGPGKYFLLTATLRPTGPRVVCSERGSARRAAEGESLGAGHGVREGVEANLALHEGGSRHRVARHGPERVRVRPGARRCRRFRCGSLAALT